MVIHGKERGLLLTVGASVEISKLCPGGDMKLLGEVLSSSGNYQTNVDAIARIVIEMNKGYECSRKFEEPGYEPDVITEEELYSLPPRIFKQLQDEAVTAFRSGTAATVEVEPSKKNEDVAPL